jgi:Mn-dependent DtxR family transcriptional regulator
LWLCCLIEAPRFDSIDETVEQQGFIVRARDLADSDTPQFTHEFIAEMLGVRRTSVTLHARTLQQAGLIKYSRGKIQIIDV